MTTQATILFIPAPLGEHPLFSAGNDIAFYADVILLGASPQLEVDASGNVVTAEGVTYENRSDAVVVGPIAQSAGASSARFEAGTVINPINGSSIDSLIWGDAHFSLSATLGHVSLTNYSTKDLVVNDIQTQVDPSGYSIEAVADRTDGFSWDVAPDPVHLPTLVDILNLSATGQPEISLNGFINNPIGTTNIFNTRGDILSTSETAGVRTNILDIEATLGNIGNTGLGDHRVDVQITESAGRPNRLVGTAGGDLYLSLEGLLGDPGLAAMPVRIDPLDAGGDINLVLADSVFDPGLTGTGSEEVDSVYTFSLTEAGE